MKGIDDTHRAGADVSKDKEQRRAKIFHWVLLGKLKIPDIAFTEDQINAVFEHENLPELLRKLVLLVRTPVDTTDDQAANVAAEMEVKAYVQRIVEDIDKTPYEPVLRGLIAMYQQQTPAGTATIIKDDSLAVLDSVKDASFMAFVRTTLTTALRRSLLARKHYEHGVHSLDLDRLALTLLPRLLISIDPGPLPGRTSINIFDQFAHVVAQIHHPKEFIFQAKSVRDEKPLNLTDDQIIGLAKVLYGNRFEYAELAAEIAEEGFWYKESQAVRSALRKGLGK